MSKTEKIDWRAITREERIELIKSVWFDGISGSEISRRISALTLSPVSRSAIIGTYDRCRSRRDVEDPLKSHPLRSIHWRYDSLAEAVRRRKLIEEAKEKSADTRKRVIPQPEILTATWGPKPTEYDRCSANLPLHLVPRNGCVWPVHSEGTQHLFCGLPIKEGKRYCPVHHLRGIRKRDE